MLKSQYSAAEWAAIIAEADPRRKSLVVVPQGFGMKGAHGRTLEYLRLAKKGHLMVTPEMLDRLMRGKEFDEIDCEVVEKLLVRAGACSVEQTELLVSMIPQFVNLVCLVVHFEGVDTRLDFREFSSLRRIWVKTFGHCTLLPPRNLEGLTLTGNVTFMALPSSLTFFSANDVRQTFTIAEDNRFGRENGILDVTSRGGFTVRVPHTLRDRHMRVVGMEVERYGGDVETDSEGEESDGTDIAVDDEDLEQLGEPAVCGVCLETMSAGMAVYTCAHRICRDCVAKFRQRRGGFRREPRYEALQVCAQCRAEPPPPRVMRF